jgi:hypothetical protein
VILMTGAIGDPAGVPLPAVKTTICALRHLPLT